MAGNNPIYVEGTFQKMRTAEDNLSKAGKLLGVIFAAAAGFVIGGIIYNIDPVAFSNLLHGGQAGPVPHLLDQMQGSAPMLNQIAEVGRNVVEAVGPQVHNVVAAISSVL